MLAWPVIEDKGLFTILNWGLAFPESPSTNERCYSRFIFAESTILTNDHVVTIRNARYSDADMPISE